MPLKSFQSNVINGRGLWTPPMRWGLTALEACYRWAVTRRNAQFESGVRDVVRLDVPVISVGNITTGGTGKTPLVIDLVKRLTLKGRRPAVISRGYKSQNGHLGDELSLVKDECPDAICIPDPDRISGGRTAIARGADAIVLDDAYQHRRIARDLDIVVIDATNPFGLDHLLPLGQLREPIEGLRRADLIVISRADLVDAATLGRIEAQLSAAAPRITSVHCRHRPKCLRALDGRPVDRHPSRVFLVAAIGNPDAFADTVGSMGFVVVGHHWLQDHHRYTPRDVVSIAEAARDAHCDVMLTTAKDATKLRTIDTSRLPPLFVVEIDMEFLDDGDAELDARLDSVLGS